MGEGPAPLIQLGGVSKRFGAHLAVDGLSLDLREGEFFCLLGPSGCGKSTLLRLVAGLERADGGTIALDGRDLSEVPPHRRPVNMMFQSYALFPHMTVAGNIGYGLATEPLGRAGRAARVDAMVRLARLGGLERRYPAQLSGGQRQRVALARALARAPRVLLLDEPLAALDRSLREETRAELKALQATLRTTFVMVTHDQDEALAIADRIGIMHEGRLVQVGSPRDLYERPRTRFVAAFLGDANLLEGVVAGRDGPVSRVTLANGATIAGRGEAEWPAGVAVAVAIRPERVGIRAGPARPGELAGTLAEIAFVGPSVHYRVAVEAGPTLRVSRPNDGAPPAARTGEAVALAIPAEAAVILP